jgi:UrcA family protein
MKPVSATFGLLATAGALALMTTLVVSDASAQAIDGGQQFTFAFSYQPEELSDSGGAQAVFDRLETSLRKSCREAGDFTPVEGYRVEQCVSTNLKSAIRQIGNPVLAEYASGRVRS